MFLKTSSNPVAEPFTGRTVTVSCIGSPVPAGSLLGAEIIPPKSYHSGCHRAWTAAWSNTLIHNDSNDDTAVTAHRCQHHLMLSANAAICLKTHILISADN